MPEQDTAAIDSLWQELTTQREVELAEARAQHAEGVAEAERLFAWRLAERLIGRIKADRPPDPERI